MITKLYPEIVLVVPNRYLCERSNGQFIVFSFGPYRADRCAGNILLGDRAMSFVFALALWLADRWRGESAQCVDEQCPQR